MKRLLRHTPLSITFALVLGALAYGPIHQPPTYNAFADHEVFMGIPHVGDVLSNLGFALVALWGWFGLGKVPGDAGLDYGWAGYRLFLAGLFFTALGSSYYHWAPDNARLVWDRLPIALACGGLLAGVWGDAHRRHGTGLAVILSAFAVASVAWWRFTDLAGSDDLRPYLLLQVLPLILIPLWQWLTKMPKEDRWFFGVALALYAVAKWAEINDHEIAAMTGFVTGHTLKHLLATVAAGIITARLVWRSS